MDFTGLVKQALHMQLEPKNNQLGHLVLVPSPEHNAKGDFGLDAQNNVTEQGQYTFAGFSVLHPTLFAGLQVDFIPLAPILRKAMQGQSLTGQLETALWSDIGTIERLQTTEALVCP